MAAVTRANTRIGATAFRAEMKSWPSRETDWAVSGQTTASKTPAIIPRVIWGINPICSRGRTTPSRREDIRGLLLLVQKGASPGDTGHGYHLPPRKQKRQISEGN